MGELLNIIIRTLDVQELQITITGAAKIGEIKIFINLRSGIPINRQRLLYQGSLLNDEDVIEEIGISDNDILYLVGNLQQSEDPFVLLAQISLLNSLSPPRQPRALSRNITNQQITEVLRQNLYVVDDLISSYNESGTQAFRQNLREGQ